MACNIAADAARIDTTDMQRWLIVTGLVLLVTGLLWPWLSQLISGLALGRLPGDIYVEKEGFRFYFPLMTGIIVSVIISIILWIFRR